MASDFTPTPYCVQATIIGVHVSAKQIYNVLHFEAPTALPSLAEVTAIAEMVAQWVNDQYVDVYSNRITVSTIHARSMAAEPGPEYDAVVTDGIGANNGDPLPLSQTCVTKLHTGLTGRSNQGRFNVFPASENEQTLGLFTPTYALACEFVIGQLVATATTADYPLVVWSRTQQALHLVTSGQANIIPRTLRSRAVDHGI